VQLRGGKLNIRKVQPINDLSEYLKQVSEDEQLVGPMRQLMGGHKPILMEEKLNYKQLLHQPIETAPFNTTEYADRFQLHHDWVYCRQQGYPGETLSSAICIDDSTEENGPLRIVPDSHAKDWPMLNPDPTSGDGSVPEDLFEESERVPCLAPAGSVMLFHAKLLHDSCANNTGQLRRIMMIYSHYPGYHQAEPDQRNRRGREAAQKQEEQYRRMVTSGEYSDRFYAASEVH
jgi:ectoine hydroxylase-related dioxygenase (phytanoyl-CoA dioxygenase family)